LTATGLEAPHLPNDDTARAVRRLVVAAIMCLILGGLAGLLVATMTKPAPPLPRFIPARELAYDFHLRDQNGRPASLADERGKVIVMAFLYTSCRDVCPAGGAIIAGALRQAGGNAVGYAVSVDPVGDTPARARAWLKGRGFTPQDGRYLLGTRAQLRPVWLHYGIAPIHATPAEAKAAAAAADRIRAGLPATKGVPPVKYAFPPLRKPTAPQEQPYPNTNDLQYRGHVRHVAGWDFEHSAYVMLIDKHGVQRVGIPFENVSPDGLVHDIRTLEAEQ
jgi:cytochrome oxidase Cu insertion factor (SCO1/SenC/PrrC family)